MDRRRRHILRLVEQQNQMPSAGIHLVNQLLKKLATREFAFAMQMNFRIKPAQNRAE